MARVPIQHSSVTFIGGLTSVLSELREGLMMAESGCLALAFGSFTSLSTRLTLLAMLPINPIPTQIVREE